MKQEIKQRIEQIKKGQVPKGYKKTEFGIFPCDWVTDKKLVDIGVFGKGKGLPGNKMTDEGVPCVGYGDIYMKYNHFHFEEALSFVDEKTASESQPINPGTLLFTGTGETAEEIGKCVCYNGDETIYAGGDIITFVPNGINPLFLAYQQYQSFSLSQKYAYGQGHSVVHIQRDSLEKLKVAYPLNKKEQEKIAEILMKWDKVIGLKKRKIEALKKLKKGYLSKMFPKKGSTYPEFRFSDFTDPWKQRKLGKLVEFYNGDRSSRYPNDKDMVADGIPFINAGDLVSGRVKLDTANKITKEKYNELSGAKIQYGDIIYCLRGTLGKNAFVDNFDVGTIASSLVDIRPQSINGKYLFHILNSDIEYRQRVVCDEGAAQPNLSAKNLSQFDIPVPNELEQVKIGHYFENFDNLITLHQRDLEKTEKQRESLIQLLLSGIVRVKNG